MFVFVGCLTSQQQASVSQGRICSDNFTCCHTEIEVAEYLQRERRRGGGKEREGGRREGERQTDIQRDRLTGRQACR